MEYPGTPWNVLECDSDPLTTLATIQSQPRQQVNQQYLMSPTLLPYSITIDHK